MKKCFQKMVVLLAALTLLTAASAEELLDLSVYRQQFAQYSVEDLLALRAIIDEELENRQYETADVQTYILNINTKKFHLPSCASAVKTKEKNKKEFTGEREQLLESGYAPCGNCNP